MIERLRALDSTALSDALDQLGLDGLVTGLRALSATSRVAGRAVTVRLGPAGESPAGPHLGTSAIEHAGPDDVIVVAHPGPPDVAGWGGNLQLAAARRGIAGVIVDGPVRDADEIRALDPAMFARGTTPRSARGRLREDAWNEPVIVGGVQVRPGDLVLADGSGVIVVPVERGEDALQRAEDIVASERALAERIRAGEPVGAVMGARYERQLARG